MTGLALVLIGYGALVLLVAIGGVIAGLVARRDPPTMAWDEIALARRRAQLEPPGLVHDPMEQDAATVEAIFEDEELAVACPYLSDEQRRAIIRRRHQEARA